MEQYHVKFVEKPHHLKRHGHKAFVYSRCFRGHNLHSRLTEFCTLSAMYFFAVR